MLLWDAEATGLSREFGAKSTHSGGFCRSALARLGQSGQSPVVVNEAKRIRQAKVASKARQLLSFALGVIGACGGDADEERHGWYEPCEVDAECAEGRCVCGMCSVQCAATCDSGPPGSSCLGDGHWAFELLCAGRPLVALCVGECDEGTACPAGLECVDRVCLPTEAVERAREHGVQVGRATGGACGVDGVLRHSALVWDQESVDALAGCTSIDGNLDLFAFDGIDPEPLRSLRVVSGAVSVSRNPDAPAMSDPQSPLAGLENLEEAGGVNLLYLHLDSLEPLAKLRRVRAQVSDGRFAVLEGSLTDLRGLALEEVDTLSLDTSELTSLEGIGAARVGRLFLTNTALSNLAGFEQVTGLRELRLTVNNDFESFEGLGDTSSLTEIVIDVSLGLSTLAGLGDASALDTLTIGYAPNLPSLEGLSLPPAMSSIDLQALPLTGLSGLEGLREVADLSLRSLDIVDLRGLDGLERIDRLILSNDLQTSLEGLGAPAIRELQLDGMGIVDLRGLERVTGLDRIHLAGNSALATLAGLGELGELRRFSSIGNAALASLGVLSGALGLIDVRIEDEHALASLNGLSLPAEVDDIVLSAPQLVDIGALAPVVSVRTLALERMAIVNLDGLSSLRRARTILINANPSLVNVDALGQLEVTTPHLTISENPLLVSLPGFAGVGGPFDGSLPEVSSSQISIWGNAALLSGPEFPALENVGYLNVSDNLSLAQIVGFANLRAARDVRIANNSGLTLLDLGVLEVVTDRLEIVENPQLGDEQLERLIQLPIEGVKTVNGN